MTNSSASRQEHASKAAIGYARSDGYGLKRIARALQCLVLLLALIPSAQPVSAQDTPETIGILIVDMQRLQRDAAAAVSVRRQSAALRAGLEETIKSRAAAISREEAELAELREQLPAAEFRERVRGFEERVFANRDFAQRESAKLQALLAEASTRLRRSIAPILATLMRERRASVMLDSSQVVLSVDTLDITEEVILRLNEAMPTMVLTPIEPPE